MSIDFYTCERCGAAFGIAGDSDGSNEDREADERHQELVQWHEDKHCTPLARTPLERARLLDDGLWAAAEEDLPSEATASALLALAEEQRTANLIAVLALPSAVKTKPLTDAKNRLTTEILERLGIGGAS